ncbi:MAG: hypothetical protein P0Y65_18980 [Candidatus Devosia phytovorans]|uniref:Uncharacterized protein n=1 Tax=Candidatus Devosia phytovorans TaxID=3121372 RepID=A0AAJ6B176_9HYPH|nr:hypothetical protein [Devosia sp.]WEK04238.1 MAG: hypothetical protein P0Y65_18980 [Devosia sp.]
MLGADWLYIVLFVVVILGAVLAVGMANNIKRKRGADDFDKDAYR